MADEKAIPVPPPPQTCIKNLPRQRVYIFAISVLSPLEKGLDPLYEQIWNPVAQKCFVPIWIDSGFMVLEKTIFLIVVTVFLQFYNFRLEQTSKSASRQIRLKCTE